MSSAYGAAAAWAESELGVRVTEVGELTGGLTSTMLALTHADGGEAVLRLMTEEPWRTHGPALTARERAAQQAVAATGDATGVPAPRSLAIDTTGSDLGMSAHLMTRVPGSPAGGVPDVVAMAEQLARIHAVTPAEPFRDYQSWAPEAKHVVPEWSRHPASWRRAFAVLAGGVPAYEPTFLHRDFSHRNLLWHDGEITGVVDWVETSTGPAWLDAGHAATNLAMSFGPDVGLDFLAAYAEVASEERDDTWLVMDAVGFLPLPGRPPLFSDPGQLARLDAWVHGLVGGPGSRACV